MQNVYREAKSIIALSTLRRQLVIENTSILPCKSEIRRCGELILIVQALFE